MKTQNATEKIPRNQNHDALFETADEKTENTGATVLPIKSGRLSLSKDVYPKLLLLFLLKSEALAHHAIHLDSAGQGTFKPNLKGNANG